MTIYPDADTRNADWPKRTPDVWDGTVVGKGVPRRERMSRDDEGNDQNNSARENAWAVIHAMLDEQIEATERGHPHGALERLDVLAGLLSEPSELASILDTSKRLSSPWTRYDGPRGGKGWVNSETGRVVYTQGDAPGSRRKERGERADKALSVINRLARREDVTAQDLQDMADHLPALTGEQLRSAKSRLMVRGGGPLHAAKVQRLREWVAEQVGGGGKEAEWKAEETVKDTPVAEVTTEAEPDAQESPAAKPPEPATPLSPESHPDHATMRQTALDAAKEMLKSKRDPVARIPDLFDKIKEKHPTATRADMEAVVHDLKSRGEIALQIANDRELESRIGETIETQRGAGHYVAPTGEAASPEAAARNGREIDRLRGELAEIDKQGAGDTFSETPLRRKGIAAEIAAREKVAAHYDGEKKAAADELKPEAEHGEEEARTGGPGRVPESVDGGIDGGIAGRDAGQGGAKPAGPRIVTARAGFTKTGNPELVPASVKPHLNEVQQQGTALAIDAITNHGGFLLADGTGVGKTRQMLATAQHFIDKGKKVVVVAPAEVIKPDWGKGTMSGSWANDGAAMGVKTSLIKGDGKIEPGAVHVTSYNELGKLKDQIDKDTILIYDESHSMKNRTSARFKHGKEASDKAGGVMYATATPGDKPLHIAHLAKAGVFGNAGATETYEKLGMRLVDQRTHGGGSVKCWQIDPKVGYTEAARRMSGLFDQLTKDGLMVKRELSMDGVHFGTDHIELDDKQHAEINKVYGDVLAKTDNNKAVALMAARLHQEPMKIPHAVKAIQEELAAGRSPVLFLGRVNDIGGDNDDEADDTEKVLGELGHHSEGTAKALKRALIEAGIPESDIGELHGGAASTTPAAKKKTMEDFQKNKQKIIIATLQSGGTGINLDDTTGERPRTMIMMTPPFTANDMAQGIGRVHRLNTKSESKIRGILSDTAIDRWNADLLHKKFQMLGATAGGDITRGTSAVGGDFADLEEKDKPAFEWGESLKSTQKHYHNTPFSHNDVIKQFGGKRTKQGGNWTTEFPSKEHFEKYQEHVKPKPRPATAPAPASSRPPTDESPYISDSHREAIHQALRQLAGNDTDRARERNSVGFNQMDSEFGGKLAESESLTDRQAAAAAKMLGKYHRQLSPDLHAKAMTFEKRPEQSRAEPAAPPKEEPKSESKPQYATRKVSTKNGERHVYSFSPDDSFWNLWRADKDKVKDMGAGLGKNPRTNDWEVTIWGKSPEDTHRIIERLKTSGVKRLSLAAIAESDTIWNEGYADNAPRESDRYAEYRRQIRAALNGGDDHE